MSNGSELKSPSAHALREAGFVPLPRWWVRQEDMDLIQYMALKYAEEVNTIREQAREEARARAKAAWKQYMDERDKDG